MRKIEITIILALVVVIGGFLYWWNKDNTVSLNEDGQTTLSATQIASIKAIGTWEFLSVSDEELVDTVRKGFFGDDELIRIYYGTLRIGIDMGETAEDWIKTENDSLVCILPPVKLLDHNFIDEARTKSFYESGKWTGQDRQDLYQRAYNAMTARCLTDTQLDIARRNARTQFGNLFRTMGFNKVKIMIEGEKEE